MSHMRLVLLASLLAALVFALGCESDGGPAADAGSGVDVQFTVRDVSHTDEGSEPGPDVVQGPDVAPEVVTPPCLTDAECDDGNPCTVDTCDPVDGCVHTDDDGAACDDGDPCTENDICAAGQCAGTQGLGCGCESESDCAPFEDGDLCNGTLLCVDGLCRLDPESVVHCPSATDPCLVNVCAPGTGMCAPVPGPDGVACDDGDPCTSEDQCHEGQCDGSPVLCDDENACTTDTCDPASGACVFTPVVCDDQNACNGVETCDAALGCVAGTPLVCDDEDACDGVETCDAALGCVAGTPLACNDEDACNGMESCDPALGCVAGTPLVCDDGDACNGVESCDAALGCVAGTPLVCDDGDACDGVESCDPALGCVAGTPLECDDEDACNGVESCDPALGCVAGTPLVCDDGDACNGLETCDAALGCVAGTPLNCDDLDPCTADSCDATLGCQNIVTDGLPCDDGDACTEGDVCGDGQCNWTTYVCPEIDCENGVDDDFDGATDCADPDCAELPVCVPTCLPVEVLTCDDVITDDTTGAPAVVSAYSCLNWSLTGPELAYAFAPETSGEITVNLTGMSVDLDLVVLGEACQGDRCVAQSAGTSDEELSFTAEAGSLYFIVVDGYGGAAGAFTLSLSCTPPCVPDCSQTQCGPDPVCGQDCGPCAGIDVCYQGSCMANPCADMPPEGCCEDGHVSWCEFGSFRTLYCGTNPPPDDVCGWSEQYGFFDCGGADEIPQGISPHCPWACVPSQGCAELQLECGPHPECPDIDCGRCEGGDVCQEGLCLALDGRTCAQGIPVRLPAQLGFLDLTSNCGLGDAESETCLGNYDSGEDLFYTLTVTETTSLQISIDSGATAYAGLALAMGCDSLDSCLATVTGAAAGVKNTGCLELAPGDYTLMIDTWATPDCIPDLTVTIVDCEPETDCGDLVDNDGDLLIDCEDPDCRLDPICLDCTRDEWEPNDDATVATPLAPASPLDASICPADDLDVYTFALELASEVIIETSGQVGDTRMWLFDAEGLQIAYDDDDGANAFSRIEASLEAGSYYVLVDEFGNNATLDYAIRLDVTALPPEDCANELDDDEDGLTDCDDPDCASACALPAPGYAAIQSPLAPLTRLAGEEIGDIYGRVWVDGVTNFPGRGRGVQAEWGYGPDGTLPDEAGWTWFPAEYNGDLDNDDEYRLNPSGILPGEWDFAYRFSTDFGDTWLYADNAPGGNVDGYSVDTTGALFVARIEAACDDELDNDGDGLTDCDDEDCAEDESCLPTCEADAEEPNGAFAAAAEILDGETLSLSICPVGDNDFFFFLLEGPAQVVVETAGEAGDTRMWLYDESETQIGYNDDVSYPSNPFSRIETHTLPAGLYYVLVDEFGNDAEIPAYTLTLSVSPPLPEVCDDGVDNDLDGDTDCDDAECVDDPACTLPAPAYAAIQHPLVPILVAGRASTGDMFGRVWVEGVTNGEGQGAGVLAEWGYGPQDVDPSVFPDEWRWFTAAYNGDLTNDLGELSDDEYVYEASHIPVGDWSWGWRFSTDGGAFYLYGDNGPLGSVDGWSSATAGVLTVNPTVEECDDGYDNDGDGATDCEDEDCAGAGVCNLCQEDEFEPNDSRETAAPLYDGDVLSLTMCQAGNRDFFHFTVEAPARVTLETAGEDGDSRLWLWDEAGTLLAYNDDISYPDNFFSRIVHGPVGAGTYFVEVGDWGYSAPESYTLSLTLTYVEDEDCADGVDNDLDGDTDCDDADCEADAACLPLGLVLSEVFYNPSGTDDQLEWVELYNAGASAVDLAAHSLGWGGTSYLYGTLQLAGSVAPGECFVVGGPLSSELNFSPVLDQAADFAPDIQNGGSDADGVALFASPASALTSSSVPIDAVLYGAEGSNNNGLLDESGLPGTVSAPNADSDYSIERSLLRPKTWRTQAAPTPGDCSSLWLD